MISQVPNSEIETMSKEIKERTLNLNEIIVLNDKYEFVCSHSSHEDNEEPTDLFIVEFKVLTTASGFRIKVEKDYQRKEEQKRVKRITRHQAKLEKDRQLSKFQDQNRENCLDALRV